MFALVNRFAGPLFIGVVAANVFVAYAIQSANIHELRVSLFDIGSGNAILVRGPTGSKVLIDGGSDASILRALGKELSPFERTLSAVIETRQNSVAIAGLTDVFKDYKVRSTFSPSSVRRGDRINLGGGAYIDVLFPDRDASVFDDDTASLVLRVVYGKTSFLITSAAPAGVEDYLVQLDGTNLKSDVLMVGHRTKKVGTSTDFIAAVAAKYTASGAVRFVSDGVSVKTLK